MREWFGKTKDNCEIREKDINWDKIKNEVKSLSFNNNGQIISLPENLEYIQAKTASSMLGTNKIDIESRYIGFIYRNITFKLRINEKTDNISVEIEPCELK